MKISSTAHISHLLFVDNIIIFGHGLVKELDKMKEVLELYCKPMGMRINMNKFTKLINEFA